MSRPVAGAPQTSRRAGSPGHRTSHGIARYSF